MVRIVDILKNVGDGDKEKKKMEEIHIPSPELPAQETKDVCLSLVGALEDIISKKETNDELIEKVRIFVMNLEKLIDSQIASKTSIIDSFLEKTECKNITISRAIKIVIIAVRMGIDVMYNKKKLTDLALTALLSDLESSNIDTRVVKEILTSRLKINISTVEFENIIRLAQIYKL